MAARKKLVEPETAIEEGGGLYFDEMPEAKEFIHSGCTLLDRVLGGGWALGRISNVYGQSSAGKTLIGLEALANFSRQFPNGKMFYRERESAFNFDYAATLGVPIKLVDFRDYESGLDSVEDLYDDMTASLLEMGKSKEPAIYGIDSLDAFPDADEIGNDDIRKSGAGGIAKKARVLSQSFRQTAGKIAKTRMHVMYISQLRAKIGVTMGRKTDMVGGNAIRFYASQRLMLRVTGQIKHEVKGLSKVVGVNVVATNEKSKVGLPYRSCEFPLLFNYGIDDVAACVDFLVSTGDAKRVGIDPRKKGDAATYIKETYRLGEKDFTDQLHELQKTTRDVWDEVEVMTAERFLPPRKKY